MAKLFRYHVVPAIPPALAPLVEIAKNLWWSWNAPARALFEHVDAEMFDRVNENPLALLARTEERRLHEIAADAAFLGRVAAVTRSLDAYLSGPSWCSRELQARGVAHDPKRPLIAYFSMEFGIHECLPVYSGGLGVLAGDHLKSASDLGVPLVGLGIAFSQGYFRQTLDDEGWQNERYPPNDWHDLPVALVTHDDGSAVRVTVALPTGGGVGSRTRDVQLAAWRVEVGRVPLYLLDANLEENAPEDRALTNTLYGGDRGHRIRQEILLGVGGVRLLAAAGVRPMVCHMNEGHSAFLALERVRQLMADHGATFEVASEAAAASNVFTTHTPVPAGNDAFAHDLIQPYLEVLGTGVGKSAEEMLRIGRVDPQQHGSDFSMPVLAIRMSDRYNGVSMLHGREARAMWHVLWPRVPSHEVPIGSITNGVHVGSWVAPELADLYDRHLGRAWRDDAADPASWQAIAAVPDGELWEAHERCRARLVAEVRRRMRVTAEDRGRLAQAGELRTLLDPRALTLGFARRFATYKRGTLLLRDRDRLLRILASAERPVQLVFSGKAHPQDWGGKELIRDIVRASRTDPFRGRIVFVEDYDMGVARSLVAGVDVWLNTPRRPLEASGTSGMKACLNGAMHASVLDGWWCEAYAGDNGWAIGHGEEYADAGYGDHVEAQALYRLLEDEIVPLFYERGHDGLPHAWIARMKRSIATIAPIFNTARMVKQYVGELYGPALERARKMLDDGLEGARAVRAWKARVAAAWPEVKVETVTPVTLPVVRAGGELAIAAEVHLGQLAPGDVTVEVYYGKLNGAHALHEGLAAPMRSVTDLGAGRFRFEGSLPARESGEHAFAVRVAPHHETFADRFAARLVSWN